MKSSLQMEYSDFERFIYLSNLNWAIWDKCSDKFVHICHTCLISLEIRHSSIRTGVWCINYLVGHEVCILLVCPPVFIHSLKNKFPLQINSKLGIDFYICKQNRYNLCFMSLQSSGDLGNNHIRRHVIIKSDNHDEVRK